MKREIEFGKTLEEVKRKAREQQNFITKTEVEEAFQALSLSAEQMEMVYAYLRQNKIGVDEPLNEDSYLEEEERDYLDSYLEKYCQPDSCLGGEPKLGAAPGIEASTGSLGHGLSFAVGIALACKMNHYDNKVYVILGDGECQEGSVWEAAMSAVRYKLDNLVVIMDDNKLQAMDTVEEIMGISSWKERWEAFGFEVYEVDGHNLTAIENELRKENHTDQPRLIISHTIKGHGVSFMEKVPIWHFRMPNAEELEIIKKELDISEEELVR